MKKKLFFLIFLFAKTAVSGQSAPVLTYLNDLKTNGQDPIEFVKKALTNYDLVVFDDALHPAYEPFVFYNSLINNKSASGRIDYIFLEAISTAAQPLIDRFLNAETKDSTKLIKVFQDDYSGLGWRFQTYLDLFSTVWEHNHRLPDSLKIKLIGVNPPVYWDCIRTWNEYELFQSSLKARDYYMYLEILERMSGFRKGEKGLFLTNTRHAYKNIKDSKGQLYWNTTTFFNQRNPDKVFSIRIHNVTLSIESSKTTTSERKSTDGLAELVYKWIKMDDGRWESAFAMNDNKPVAVPLKNSSFGQTAYVGNLMRDVAPGTTMYDAYDAIIFLAPLTELRFSAQFNYIYTSQFKPELERRLKLLKPDFEAFLKSNAVSSFDAYYEEISKYKPVSKNALLKE
jgi:hypothetical protein